MWVYALVIILVIYAIYKERQAMGCGNISDQKDCDNANGKAVKGSKSHQSESTSQILDRISFGSCYNDRFVKWRGIYLISVTCIILMWFVIYNNIPSQRELIIGIIVLMLVITLALSFYKFHLQDHVQRNIQHNVDILKQRV